MKKKLTILTVLIVAALFMYAGCDLLTGSYRDDIRIPSSDGVLTLTVFRYNFITGSGKYQIETNVGNVKVESGNIKISGWSEKKVTLSNRKNAITGDSMENYTTPLSGDGIIRYPYFNNSDLSVTTTFYITELLIP
ncbi:hypothetical protein [Treponema maltophilum]|uniref:hypothetical protein n=1 Tax=Treponema maltophilum TaxID=51160 RepID=UPI003D947C2B